MLEGALQPDYEYDLTSEEVSPISCASDFDGSEESPRLCVVVLLPVVTSRFFSLRVSVLFSDCACIHKFSYLRSGKLWHFSEFLENPSLWRQRQSRSGFMAFGD